MLFLVDTKRLISRYITIGRTHKFGDNSQSQNITDANTHKHTHAYTATDQVTQLIFIHDCKQSWARVEMRHNSGGIFFSVVCCCWLYRQVVGWLRAGCAVDLGGSELKPSDVSMGPNTFVWDHSIIMIFAQVRHEPIWRARAARSSQRRRTNATL